MKRSSDAITPKAKVAGTAGPPWMNRAPGESGTNPTTAGDDHCPVRPSPTIGA